MSLDLAAIRRIQLPAGQFQDEAAPKSQIVLHHTASGDGAAGDIQYWANTPERVATAFVLERSGILYQAFHSSRWAYHLGISHPRWPQHDRQSIGIEIDSWGYLEKKGDRFFSWAGVEVPADRVQKYDIWKGCRYFEKYTPAQIATLRDLLIYLGEKYRIPLGFGFEIFDLNRRALNIEPGVFAHASYRKDKTDAHPQPELLALGSELKDRIK